MDISLIIGASALFITILYLGTDYVLQNYFALKTQVPPALLMTVKIVKLLMFAAWMAYGWAKQDAFLLFGQSLGLLTALMIIGLMFWTRTVKSIR